SGCKVTRLAAVRAKSFCQSLGHRKSQCCGHLKRLDAHIDKPSDDTSGRVGVQRTEYQVPCKCGFDGNVGRFKIADFADHNHVGVAAQDVSQHGRKLHLVSVVDFRL